MIKVVLLDLDDTLLYYPRGVNFFVGSYLQDLVAHLQHLLPEAQSVLIEAVRAIIKNTDPTRRNDIHYREALRRAAQDEAHYQRIRAELDRYYAESYPHLQSLTQPIPLAVELVKGLRQRGYTIALATNPLYPARVIEARMRWAGFDPLDGTFSRVTHAENTHFSKPQPHYFEELMTWLGHEPYEAIMVGDNWDNDIVSAAQTGMRTFWVQNPFSQPDDQVTADGQGSLQEFAECVFQHHWLDTLPPKTLERPQVIPRMLGNVGALLGMVDGLPEHFWHQRPDPQEWSPLEIVLHLAESEREVQRPHLEAIAHQDNPFLRSPKTPFHPFERDLSGLAGYEAALRFAAERQKTVQFLETLSPDDWARPARHSIYGPTTLLELAAFTTRHDQLHIKQLCQTIGKCE